MQECLPWGTSGSVSFCCSSDVGEMEEAGMRSGGPVAFTSQHSMEGISLCCCVLFRSMGRGLQGSVKGHNEAPGCVCVWQVLVRV